MFTKIISRSVGGKTTKCFLVDMLRGLRVSEARNGFSTITLESRKSQPGRRNMSQKIDVFSEQDFKILSSSFPEVVDTLTEVKPWNQDRRLVENLRVVLEKNVNFWTNSRGAATIGAYKVLEKTENLTDENIRLASILAWCGKLFEAAIIITDDMVDNSETRGCVPCWYKNKNVGMRAAFDAIYLENAVFQLLKKYFSTHPQYQQIVEEFHNSNFNMMIGQLLDCITTDLKNFNMEHYKLVAHGKGSQMFFFIPIVLHFANFPKELRESVRPIIDKFGQYYQVQNDYLDIYGDAEETGKIGTDIMKGKCTWLAIRMMEEANYSQRNLMLEHYGKNNQKSVQIVRNLYDELEFEDEYKQRELHLYEEIRQDISELSNSLNHELFYSLLDGLRDKKWIA
ncbi:uncharacterized protein [Leptinotarsa decemlineata]|uniref:uncharacterized protein n=1 Tax=Leptinotarsa decemlineata TaxID=7539 RepID=UPI000C2548AA|nr:farnesyl pyrophosphate synthase-like [Leptinotarsa decemlineata]